MIVITTPTGQIGRQVLGNLLDSGEQLRVIARDPSKLPAGVRKDLDIVEGSHGDAAVVDKAFAGADAVLWLTTRSFDHGMPSGLSQAQQRAHDIEEPAVEPANDAGEQEGCGRRRTGRPVQRHDHRTTRPGAARTPMPTIGSPPITKAATCAVPNKDEFHSVRGSLIRRDIPVCASVDCLRRLTAPTGSTSPRSRGLCRAHR